MGIYDLKLFDYFFPDNNSSFRRVPGGWVYGDIQGCCFIPYSDEFKPLNKVVEDGQAKCNCGPTEPHHYCPVHGFTGGLRPPAT